MTTASPNIAVGEPLAAGSASATDAASGAAAGSAGFLALIGALLQESGPALVAATATTATTGTAVAGDVPTADAADDDGTGGTDAAALLAALAFSQGALPAAPPPPPSSTAAAAVDGSAASDASTPSIGLDAAARRSVPTPAGTADGAGTALVGDLARDVAGARPIPPGPRGAPGARDGAAGAIPQSLGSLFAPIDGAIESLANREEGAAPRSSVTAAAGTAPSPGTLLTTVANLVNGDVAPARVAAAPHDATIREQLGTPRWQEEIGNRITLMAAQGQHSGSLRLNPEHLGPVEVQITVGDEHTHVQFGAQNADTRQALQDALPRLREMFASAGLQLGQAGVSQQSPRQRPEGGLGASASGIAPLGDGEPTPLAAPVRRITHSGLLDTYA